MTLNRIGAAWEVNFKPAGLWFACAGERACPNARLGSKQEAKGVKTFKPKPKGIKPVRAQSRKGRTLQRILPMAFALSIRRKWQPGIP